MDRITIDSPPCTARSRRRRRPHPMNGNRRGPQSPWACHRRWGDPHAVLAGVVVVGRMAQAVDAVISGQNGRPRSTSFWWTPRRSNRPTCSADPTIRTAPGDSRGRRCAPAGYDPLKGKHPGSTQSVGHARGAGSRGVALRSPRTRDRAFPGPAGSAGRNVARTTAPQGCGGRHGVWAPRNLVRRPSIVSAAPARVSPARRSPPPRQCAWSQGRQSWVVDRDVWDEVISTPLEDMPPGPRCVCPHGGVHVAVDVEGMALPASGVRRSSGDGVLGLSDTYERAELSGCVETLSDGWP